MRALIDSDVAKKFYIAMILPILTNYPFSIYGTISKTLHSKIKSAERRAQRIGHSAKLPSSESFQKKCIASFVYRCLQKDVCHNFEKYFKLRCTNSIKTRNSKIMVNYHEKNWRWQGKVFIFKVKIYIISYLGK